MSGGLRSLFKKNEYLISVDIGSAGIKLIELDLSEDKPKLLNIGYAPLVGEIFSNNLITKTEKVAEQVTSLLEGNAISDKRAVTAMPGPSVFTKKIKMQKLPPAELAANIEFEAGNYIPHNIDAVRLDYHVLGEVGKNQIEVLIVAVKKEIIDSFMGVLSLAGMDTAVVDVDHFAIQNMYEMAYPEDISKTVALINMGARYSSINICREGKSLFTGDIAVGGRAFSDALMTELGMTYEVAESVKKGKGPKDLDPAPAQDLIDKNIEYVASEFNRQLSFYWNASGAEEGIDKIVLCGGGALVKGLLEELAEKTGIECAAADPLRGISIGNGFDAQYLKEIGPLMGVAIGMGIRQPGDRIVLAE
jgi:type IV pilus assembly protein PilM